jgi:hypothetical protein
MYVDTRRGINLIGRKAYINEKKESMIGYFQIGSVVTITAVDDIRGYTFEDDKGNRIIEAGWSGFILI